MSDTRTVEVSITFTAEVTSGGHTVDYGPHELTDVIMFHVGLSNLDSIEADISAFTMLYAKEVQR